VLVARFARDWEKSTSDLDIAAYRAALPDLRRAAGRLLHASDVNDSGTSEFTEFRRFLPEIRCLARRPHFFPAMFHGVQLSADGTCFEQLPPDEAVHIRAVGLIDKEDRDALQDICERLTQDGKPMTIAEIGSASGGGSTPVIGEIVKRTGGKLYCIDPWETKLRHLSFLANIKILGLEGTVIPIRSSSLDAAMLFEDSSLDGVFIDGLHLYPNVLADIDAYLPKVRSGGILFGHDLNGKPSGFCREELLKISFKNREVAKYIDNNNVTEIHTHPGVVLAVQDRFGDKIERFFGSSVWAKDV
jgi:hypothetical protein